MSAQVTEAHKQLVATIVEQAFRFAEGNHKITPLSQLIADSEARATAELRLDRYRAVKGKHEAETERDQLRAEMERLKRDYDYDHKCLHEVRERCELWKQRAERAEAEVERLRHLEALLNQAAAEVTAHTFTAGGIAGLRAENDRLRRAYVRPDDIRAQLESAAARVARAEAEVNRLKSDGAASAFVDMSCRAERAEAELAKERARLDYMSNCGFEHLHNETGDHLGHEWTISSYGESRDVTLRDVIDAEMKEETK